MVQKRPYHLSQTWLKTSHTPRWVYHRSATWTISAKSCCMTLHRCQGLLCSVKFSLWSMKSLSMKTKHLVKTAKTSSTIIHKWLTTVKWQINFSSAFFNAKGWIKRSWCSTNWTSIRALISQRACLWCRLEKLSFRLMKWYMTIFRFSVIVMI